MKRLVAVIALAFFGGVFFVAGAIGGGVLAHRNGLIIGALVGGGLSVPLNSWFASKLSLIHNRSPFDWSIALGTLLAYLLAAINLTIPVICLLSPLLIGLTALSINRKIAE